MDITIRGEGGDCFRTEETYTAARVYCVSVCIHGDNGGRLKEAHAAWITLTPALARDAAAALIAAAESSRTDQPWRRRAGIRAMTYDKYQNIPCGSFLSGTGQLNVYAADVEVRLTFGEYLLVYDRNVARALAHAILAAADVASDEYKRLNG